MTEEEEQQYAADQFDEEQRRFYEAEVKKNNAVGLVQRMLRGHLSRSKLPEITPDMGPQMPDFLQAAAPGSDVMIDMMKDTLWETNKIGMMSYKDVYAMVLQYNKKVGLKDRITLLNKTPNRTLTMARRTMLNQLKDKFQGIEKNASTFAAKQAVAAAKKAAAAAASASSSA